MWASVSVWKNLRKTNCTEMERWECIAQNKMIRLFSSLFFIPPLHPCPLPPCLFLSLSLCATHPVMWWSSFWWLSINVSRLIVLFLEENFSTRKKWFWWCWWLCHLYDSLTSHFWHLLCLLCAHSVHLIRIKLQLLLQWFPGGSCFLNSKYGQETGNHRAKPVLSWAMLHINIVPCVRVLYV